MLKDGNRDGGPSTSKRVEKQKTKIYWVRGWDVMGEGGTREQIMAPGYFWDLPRHSILKKMYKNCKKRIVICCCRWMNLIMIKCKKLY